MKQSGFFCSKTQTTVTTQHRNDRNILKGQGTHPLCSHKPEYFPHHLYRDINNQVCHLQVNFIRRIGSNQDTTFLVQGLTGMTLDTMKCVKSKHGMLQGTTSAQSSQNLKQKVQVASRDKVSDCRLSLDDHVEETQPCFVLNHIHACKLQNQVKITPSLRRPSVCPAMHYRKPWFFVVLFNGGCN